ncbi:MAG TPA: type IV secretion system DNA-binding domain-containing protein [Bryobacteraceae bacterium]|nr:type IV secretion system DNA-binding domain-containing protein [Bryobacteraceae bacterium]
MFGNLILAVGSAWAALALWPHAGVVRSLAGGFAVLSLWQIYCAASASRRSASPVMLRLGGFSWSVEDFCRGWLITGQIGTGKTTGAINRMLWQVSQNCPTWGGVCVDDKGLYWETLLPMFRQLGRERDLILLQVRPADAPADWAPTHTFNFLDNPHLPYSAKAKIVCDVAASLGQRSEQSFFRMQAQVQIEFAFQVLATAGVSVTLRSAYAMLTSDTAMKEVMALLEEQNSPEGRLLIAHYEGAFKSQPPEQLGGVKTTVANYLHCFAEPGIAEVFCPAKPSFRFDELDAGKVVCVSLPQRYQVERRYINTLLKLSFYAHALRRFDKPSSARATDNLLILWADEAQKIVTATNDGMSDYNVVDVIREARATVVAATQSYQSLIPPMNDERKAKVFIANMANRVTFCAADEDSAKIAADTLGKRKAKKRTIGYTAGKRSTSWTEEDKYWLEPHQLRKLRKFEAVVQHCNGGFKKAVLPPYGADGKVQSWYRN